MSTEEIEGDYDKAGLIIFDMKQDERSVRYWNSYKIQMFERDSPQEHMVHANNQIAILNNLHSNNELKLKQQLQLIINKLG